MIIRNRKILIFIVCILALIITVAVTKKVQEINTEKENSALYEEALRLFEEGNIELAEKKLEDIEEFYYKDKQELLEMCLSVKYYRDGNYWAAYVFATSEFEYLSEDEVKRASEYEEKVKEAYYEYKAEQDRIAEEKYQEAVAKGVPFEGMRESDIHKNNNGKYDIEVVKYTGFNNEHPNMHVYYYLIKGTKRIWCVVKCDDGKVLAVENYHYQLNRYFDSSQYGSNYDPDPFDADNYSNAEDFYDDHYDDFFDYEEAEDYYNDHDD